MNIKTVTLSSVGLSRKEWDRVEEAAKANLETEEETILIPHPRFTHTMLEGDTWERGDATPSEEAFFILLATIIEGNPTGPAELYLDPTLPDPVNKPTLTERRKALSRYKPTT